VLRCFWLIFGQAPSEEFAAAAQTQPRYARSLRLVVNVLRHHYPADHPTDENDMLPRLRTCLHKAAKGPILPSLRLLRESSLLRQCTALTVEQAVGVLQAAGAEVPGGTDAMSKLLSMKENLEDAGTLSDALGMLFGEHFDPHEFSGLDEWASASAQSGGLHGSTITTTLVERATESLLLATPAAVLLSEGAGERAAHQSSFTHAWRVSLVSPAGQGPPHQADAVCIDSYDEEEWASTRNESQMCTWHSWLRNNQPSLLLLIDFNEEQHTLSFHCQRSNC